MSYLYYDDPGHSPLRRQNPPHSRADYRMHPSHEIEASSPPMPQPQPVHQAPRPTARPEMTQARRSLHKEAYEIGSVQERNHHHPETDAGTSTNQIYPGRRYFKDNAIQGGEEFRPLRSSPPRGPMDNALRRQELLRATVKSSSSAAGGSGKSPRRAVSPTATVKTRGGGDLHAGSNGGAILSGGVTKYKGEFAASEFSSGGRQRSPKPSTSRQVSPQPATPRTSARSPGPGRRKDLVPNKVVKPALDGRKRSVSPQVITTLVQKKRKGNDTPRAVSAQKQQSDRAQREQEAMNKMFQRVASEHRELQEKRAADRSGRHVVVAADGAASSQCSDAEYLSSDQNARLTRTGSTRLAEARRAKMELKQHAATSCSSSDTGGDTLTENQSLVMNRPAFERATAEQPAAPAEGGGYHREEVNAPELNLQHQPQSSPAMKRNNHPSGPSSNNTSASPKTLQAKLRRLRQEREQRSLAREHRDRNSTLVHPVSHFRHDGEYEPHVEKVVVPEEEENGQIGGRSASTVSNMPSPTPLRRSNEDSISPSQKRPRLVLKSSSPPRGREIPRAAKLNEKPDKQAARSPPRDHSPRSYQMHLRWTRVPDPKRTQVPSHATTPKTGLSPMTTPRRAEISPSRAGSDGDLDHRTQPRVSPKPEPIVATERKQHKTNEISSPQRDERQDRIKTHVNASLSGLVAPAPSLMDPLYVPGRTPVGGSPPSASSSKRSPTTESAAAAIHKEYESPHLHTPRGERPTTVKNPDDVHDKTVVPHSRTPHDGVATSPEVLTPLPNEDSDEDGEDYSTARLSPRMMVRPPTQEDATAVKDEGGPSTTPRPRSAASNRTRTPPTQAPPKVAPPEGQKGIESAPALLGEEPQRQESSRPSGGRRTPNNSASQGFVGRRPPLGNQEAQAIGLSKE